MAENTHSDETVTQESASALAGVMRKCADEVENGELDALWESVRDMVDGTLANVRHDLGEKLGNANMFFSQGGSSNPISNVRQKTRGKRKTKRRKS